MVSSAAPELQGDPACSRRWSWPEPGYSQLRHHSSHAQLLLQPRSLVALDIVGISSRYLLQSHRYCLHFFCREYFWNVLSVHWRQTAAVLQCCSACSSLDLTTIRRNAALQACSSLYWDYMAALYESTCANTAVLWPPTAALPQWQHSARIVGRWCLFVTKSHIANSLIVKCS